MYQTKRLHCVAAIFSFLKHFCFSFLILANTVVVAAVYFIPSGSALPYERRKRLKRSKKHVNVSRFVRICPNETDIVSEFSVHGGSEVSSGSGCLMPVFTLLLYYV